jgi:signal transduction histidine kinase
MMDILGKKSRGPQTSDVILAFVQAWELHGQDEVSICSGTLDILRAYLGERPACVWKNDKSILGKICERGVIEIFYSNKSSSDQASLTKAVVTGAPAFDPREMSTLIPEMKGGYEGFLHVPIKIKEEILGVLSLAVTKKESRDNHFVKPLECLGRMIAIAMQNVRDGESNTILEKRLRSEVHATTKELEKTNKRLIDRVKELNTLFTELQRKVEELTVANKAKDEFLSIVSHELRTPLTSLNGFLCVLLDEEAGALTVEQKKFLGIAKQSADRLKILISDLLDISRIESGRLSMDMKECSLFDILRTSVDNLKVLATTKKIQIRFQSNPMLPSVWGDTMRLQQVIDNLLANAIKFSDVEDVIDVFTEEKGDFIEVSVRDFGIGIAADAQKKVFDMFFQADASIKRTAGGAGLGLAIAHGIVSLHGGRIWVESEQGKGAIFKFTIPRNRAKMAA